MAKKSLTKKQKTWITVGAVALATLVTAGAIAGIVALVNNGEEDDGLKKVSVAYEIGGLTDDGAYEKSNYTLYTKDGFDCGVRVYADIDFDANITYQLFYYGKNDVFIEATDVQTGDYDETVPDGAITCRVEITPVWDDDVKEEDKVIGWFDKGGYTDQLKLKIEPAAEVEETENLSAE